MQFVLLVFVCLSFFGVITSFVLPKFTGLSLTDIQNLSVDSAPSVRINALLTQAVGHLGIFMVPSLLFAYAVHPKPFQYLGITRPANNQHWLIVFLLVAGLLPTVSGIAGLLDKIPLSKELEEAKLRFADMQKALLNLTTPGELIAALLVIGVIPAIGEELMFRGIMMKFSAKKMKGGIIWPIMLSSVFFAAMHGNTVGVISLFIAGITLGYIYYLTGSLVLAIFAHFIVNSSQVVMIYAAGSNEQMKAFVESNDTPWGIFIGGIVLFVISFYWLYKSRTPLPANWTNDFTDAELAAKEQENINNDL